MQQGKNAHLGKESNKRKHGTMSRGKKEGRRVGEPVFAYKAGNKVEVFYVNHDRSDSYMAVDSLGYGATTPRLGQSRGWLRATVVNDFDPRSDRRVKIRYLHTKWVDRDGEALNTADGSNLIDFVPPERVRMTKGRYSRGLGGENTGVSLSILMVRWATDKCPGVREGSGGWGETGSVVSDHYIQTWLNAFEYVFPNDYQIITAYVQSSEDVVRLGAAGGAIRRMLEGRHVGAFYFIWPVTFADDSGKATDFPGYLEQTKALRCLGELESAGVSTRFPYTSHLYRLFLAKDWMAHMCLSPSYKCPATTKVSRSMIECDAQQAANIALKSLHHVRETQRKQTHLAGGGKLHEPSLGLDTAWHEMRGVAKLGYSWEATSVRRFEGHAQLAQQLQRLVNTSQNLSECVLVQDLVENFTCEVRTFVVEGQPIRRRRRFTDFEQRGTFDEDDDDDNDPADEGLYTDFKKCGRDEALATYFNNDEEALCDAEKEIDRLIEQWCNWLRCECAQLPPVFRFDAFVRRRPNGKRCDVFSGELTELGACTLGWPKADMMATLYPAVLRACLLDHTQCIDDEQASGCACHTSDKISLKGFEEPPKPIPMQKN